MQINSVNPNFASAYDQALGVIKDSLNTASPLASLNLQRVTTIALSCHPPSPSNHNIFQTTKNTGMSPPQVHHLYECLHKDIPYNPAQIDQFTWMQKPGLPEFLYHMDEDEDPVPCFPMTNPYEAMLTHDPSRKCVRTTPDMLHSLKPHEDTPDVPNGIDILCPPDSGKTNLSQVSLWSIMSDRPSYTIHPQPSGLAGSGCMDFSIDRLNRQSPPSEEKPQLTCLKVLNPQNTSHISLIH